MYECMYVDSNVLMGIDQIYFMFRYSELLIHSAALHSSHPSLAQDKTRNVSECDVFEGSHNLFLAPLQVRAHPPYREL